MEIGGLGFSRNSLLVWFLFPQSFPQSCETAYDPGASPTTQSPPYFIDLTCRQVCVGLLYGLSQRDGGLGATETRGCALWVFGNRIGNMASTLAPAALRAAQWGSDR